MSCEHSGSSSQTLNHSVVSSYNFLAIKLLCDLQLTLDECQEVVEVCKEHAVKLAVCHVLAYTPWVTLIKDTIDSGRIGEVVNIRLTGPVSGGYR